MLIGLILRGVSFDFRVKARAARKNMWNALFAIGSLMAAAAQGWMLGSYLTGFDYGLWSSLFSLGIALTLPTAYAMLGAGWLIMKTGERVAAQGGRAGPARCCGPWARRWSAFRWRHPLVSQTVFDKWFACRNSSACCRSRWRAPRRSTPPST